MLKAVRNHTVQDAGAPFEVDPFTRSVIVPYSERVIGVVGDDRSEKVTFKIPNAIDGHDMPRSSRKYVAWRNVSGEPGTDELEMTEEADDYSLYTWTVRDKTAAAKGIVDFSLHFECDDPTTGAQIYRWGTRTCSDCEIMDSVNIALGTYAAIYLDGDTLVFADYAPVTNGVLDIKTVIVPDGTLEIAAAGKHDVGRYAYAEVVLPEVAVRVSNDGVVIAHIPGKDPTTHELSSEDCPAFLPENIKKGQTIFGVEGTFGGEPVSVTWRESAGQRINALIYEVKADGSASTSLISATSGSFNTVKGAPLVFIPPAGYTISLDAASSTGVYSQSSSRVANAPLALSITGDANIVITRTNV